MRCNRAVYSYISIILLLFIDAVLLRNLYSFVSFDQVGSWRTKALRCLHYPAESVSSLQDFNESCKKFSESYIFFHRITIHGRFRYQLFKHDLLLVQLMNLIENSPELPHYFFEIEISL